MELSFVLYHQLSWICEAIDRRKSYELCRAYYLSYHSAYSSMKYLHALSNNAHPTQYSRFEDAETKWKSQHSLPRNFRDSCLLLVHHPKRNLVSLCFFSTINTRRVEVCAFCRRFKLRFFAICGIGVIGWWYAFRGWRLRAVNSFICCTLFTCFNYTIDCLNYWWDWKLRSHLCSPNEIVRAYTQRLEDNYPMKFNNLWAVYFFEISFYIYHCIRLLEVRITPHRKNSNSILHM